ncbi:MULTISPECIES: hypothetical protein [unclassified Streptomyces]|uniref:hypothetical protein n=1 Tax=unclassified Streptomyces TaxID=2593676 RepID=UPI0004BF75D7|nr:MULTISPECIES: hypothetical protein [unclassified Streptomyces]
MGTRTALRTALGEVAAWWAALFVLWLMLISTIAPLELTVGAAVSLLGAVTARGARRAVHDG